MCYLVTIGTRADRAQVETLFGLDSSLALRPSENPSLRSAFPRLDHLFDVTHGSCSCDLITHQNARSIEDQRAKLGTQYERKGWSKAKTARALADWDATHNRQFEKHTESARDLLKLLQTLAMRPGGVRVVVHFYSGRFDSEEISLIGTTRVPVEQLEIGAIREDTLTDVGPRAPSR
jgi:hypothetical protein